MKRPHFSCAIIRTGASGNGPDTKTQDSDGSEGWKWVLGGQGRAGQKGSKLQE